MNEQTFRYDEVEDALCIWEEILECIKRPGADKWSYHSDHVGMATTRMWAVDHAHEVGAAYRIALEAGYDSCFDWDFVPKFLDQGYDDSLNLVSNWQDIAKAIGEER